LVVTSADKLLRNPIGIADCCALAASGHAAAPPPRSVMKSRRLMPDPPPRYATREKRRGPDDLAQSKLFIKTAREIEADEGKSTSDHLLGRLAKMPPEPRKKPK
jgi:hypothetical protein